jgi:YVTN family beta-propeller protein
MRKWISMMALIGVVTVGCAEQSSVPTGQEVREAGDIEARAARASGRVVIANRASGSISVIDANTDAVVATVDLPMGDSAPEPMYVVHTPRKNRVFVGDRANNRVVAFDARTFEVDGMAAAGSGVFHMWADPQGHQLWVNNDIDNTTSVIDPGTLSVLATVATPADLVALGGRPHDVIVDPQGNFAYVSVLGIDGDEDYVVQFDTGSFEEIGRAAVGQDPHVSLARQHDQLYVPCQNSNVVVVLNRFTMEEITRIDAPGAHGAGMSANGNVFYTANLSGGGTDALWAIDTRTNDVIGMPSDSPFPVPHNLALNPNGKKLYVTHSGGTADKVTVYEMTRRDPVPVLVAEVTVGFNPFGLAYVR